MVPAGNKAKRLSSVNHTTKTNHHHRCNSSYIECFIHGLMGGCTPHEILISTFQMELKLKLVTVLDRRL